MKRDLLTSANEFRNLMNDIIGMKKLEVRLCELYSLIVEKIPDFQSVFSDDQLFTTFAPNHLKYQVSTFFRIIRKHLKQVKEMKESDLTD